MTLYDGLPWLGELLTALKKDDTGEALFLSGLLPLLTFFVLARSQYLIEGRKSIKHWLFGVRLSVVTLAFVIVSVYHSFKSLNMSGSVIQRGQDALEPLSFVLGTFIVLFLIVDQIGRHKAYHDHPSKWNMFMVVVVCNLLGLVILGVSILLLA